MKDLMSHLPDESRIWIYTASREFTEGESQEVNELGKTFVGNWKAHGSAIAADCLVVYNRFIVIAANEEVAGVSGCGIDSSVRFMQELEKKFQIVLLDKLNIGYKNAEGAVIVEPMISFRDKMDNGEIDAETIVFNNLVENLGMLRSSWEVPLKESWHNQLL
jgi:hypothetical protein